MSYLLHFSPRRTHSPLPDIFRLSVLPRRSSVYLYVFVNTCMHIWVCECVSEFDLKLLLPSFTVPALVYVFPGPLRYEGGKYPPTAHHSSRLFVYPLIIERSWRQYKVCACEGVFLLLLRAGVFGWAFQGRMGRRVSPREFYHCALQFGAKLQVFFLSEVCP